MSGVRGAILTVLLAAFAAGLGAWGGATYVLRSKQEPSLHEFMHEKLSLTSEQSRQLQAIEREFSITRSAREAELRMANAELAGAINAKHEYSPEVRTAIEHFHDVMGELQKETVVHILQMRAILTPEQAVIFDRRVSEALTEDAK